MDFRLRFNLSKEDLTAEIIVKKSVSDDDFTNLVRIVQKAREQDINLAPLAKFLKNPELTFLVDQGWVIDYADFTIHSSELLEYYKKKGKYGGSNIDANEEWPHVCCSEMQRANYALLLENKISPTRNYGDNGGYVLTSKFQQNQEWGRAQKQKEADRNRGKIPRRDKEEPKEEIPKAKVTLSKKEQSACRKSIIAKATTSDANAAGFKPEFVETLTEQEQAYVATLSNLQCKFMMNEISKK